MSFFNNLFKSKKQILGEKQRELTRQKNVIKQSNTKQLAKKKNAIPIITARNKLVTTLSTFEFQRTQLNLQWQQAYADFSLWNKFKYDENLDLSSLDKEIKKFKAALKEFDKKYGSDCKAIDEHFLLLAFLSEKRIDRAHKTLKDAVDKRLVKNISNTSVAATWFAGLSIPVSITDDLYNANQVYDSLRAVNGNFANMSNTEIWFETLWLSPESYAGLVSLTKGAYFEQLVAGDTGGELFEHFNNPGTDITIDGIEMQIKATDSVPYIASVDDEIPVIATSEVAVKTGAIDGGYTNEELNNTVEQALGGGVIDAKDTAIDAILSGVGTLGIFATISGINHASERYNKGVDGVEAIFEGAGVAIEGTAKGLVDASEMVYKAAMSKPSRFIGRTLVKGLKKLDDKLFEEPSKEEKR
ncbi:hypothetical protein [Pseudoalteromonas sp. NZS11]|uniref:hypothetical protein n=1 Tax=Pseudoalteromonas sp. NZS11 TaxID=2792049 RepID=UPI0018CD3F0A|nr:hypothetical protein [Pseudoalteromonas sp. NZS11]MBH0080176.1 hypothetical protein [Pseudoalteromonas sp. NZS11]